MTIQHLVLSGGGPSLFKTLGALQALERAGIWKFNNIETMYGTSAGAICAVTICLGFDWETINTYFVDRPWHEAFPITPTSLFNAYGKKGIFGKEFVIKTFTPLFGAKDIPITITMKEFYEKTNIDLFLYTTELNQFENVELSHTSFPDLELMDALHMSCALPVIIAPRCVDNKCYLDGGLGANYPVSQCIKHGHSQEHVLGIYAGSPEPTDLQKDTENHISDDSSILEYMNAIFGNMVKRINNTDNRPHLENEIMCPGERLTFEYIQETLLSKDMRKSLLDEGIKYGEDFLTDTQKVDPPMNEDNVI